MVKRNIETNNVRNVKTRTVPVVPVRGRIVRPSDTTQRELTPPRMNADFRRKNLNDMHSDLYSRICDGKTSEFKNKLTANDSNSEYINKLADQLDAYVDKLSFELQGGDIKWEEVVNFNTCDPKLSYNCSKGSAKCDFIPGGAYLKDTKGNNRPPKSLIPQIYHVLQDYGFFWEYIGFNNIDMSKSTGVVLANWGFNLGQKLCSKRTDKRKIDFLKCIIHRAYRVLFLREFDVRCCLRKNKNRNHEHFDIVINDVIFVLREKIRELESVK